MKPILLFTSLFMLITAFTCSAQKLEYIGALPDSGISKEVTIFFEDENSARLQAATFLAFKSAGYTVMLDGERRPEFSGLVTTVAVDGTSFTRQEKNVVVRSIFENKPTDLIVTVNTGPFSLRTSLTRIMINVIDRKTGQLYMSISTWERNSTSSIEEFAKELYLILSGKVKETTIADLDN